MTREAVFIVDTAWKIVHASSGSSKLFGRKSKGLVGASVFELFPPRLRDAQRSMWTSAGRESLRVDAIGTKGTKEFPLKVEVSSIGTEPALTCVIMSDVRTTSRQSQKMEALGLLAGGVAHDFNNALTAIVGFTSGVRDELEEGSPLRADLEEVLGAAQSASELTNQLLSFSRRRAAQSAPIELNRSVGEMERLLRKTLPSSIDLSMASHSSDVHVRFERSELHQILINLASNARDAMPQGGTLRVSVHCEEVRGREGLDDGRYAVVEVADSGAGIPKDIIGNIFDPFFSTKGEDGTGLGLSTCFGLARQARGTLLVTSTEGQGTVFSLYLPTCESAPPRSLTSTQGIALRRKYGAALVVEDQASVRKYLVRSLRKVGFVVVDVGSAEEAIAAFDGFEGTPELLVTDLMLGGRSGTELARTLVERAPALKVLLISGNAGPDADVTGLGEKNTEFLAKPFTVSQMRRAVEQLLNPPNRLHGDLLVVAPNEVQQREYAALFTEINLKRVFAASSEEALRHLDGADSPALICLSAELGDGAAETLLATVRAGRHSLTPVVVMDSKVPSFGTALDSHTVLVAHAPTTLQMIEALYELGLQFASA